MRFLFLFIIKIYWKLIPESRRRKCLFKESCSNHVFRITKNEGFIKGLRAFKSRFMDCRPGYKTVEIEGKAHLITANLKIYSSESIKEHIISKVTNYK